MNAELGVYRRRAGEHDQPVVVEVPVGEADERLVARPVVPAEVPNWMEDADGLVEDRLDAQVLVFLRFLVRAKAYLLKEGGWR